MICLCGNDLLNDPNTTREYANLTSGEVRQSSAELTEAGMNFLHTKCGIELYQFFKVSWIKSWLNNPDKEYWADLIKNKEDSDFIERIHFRGQVYLEPEWNRILKLKAFI